ncbi:MAG: hypothetical protein JW955_03890 [Sedimentisphaerales bacterium]|nr:hypothetical protein [Sedimentisphaerales bacterium]
MSRRTCQVTAMLAVIVLLSATTHAADPNAPSVKKDSAQSVTKPSASKPVASTPAMPAKRTPASFTPEMPFSEAVDILRNCTTPPLNIVVLWREIGENAGIYSETPIGISGVSGVAVRQSLELLLLSLSGGAAAKLGYIVRGGVITIGTVDSLPAPRKVTAVYDITDLLAEPARYIFSPFGSGGMYGGPMMGAGGGYGMGSTPGLSNVINNSLQGARRSGSRRR